MCVCLLHYEVNMHFLLLACSLQRSVKIRSSFIGKNLFHSNLFFSFKCSAASIAVLTKFSQFRNKNISWFCKWMIIKRDTCYLTWHDTRWGFIIMFMDLKTNIFSCHNEFFPSIDSGLLILMKSWKIPCCGQKIIILLDIKMTAPFSNIFMHPWLHFYTMCTISEPIGYFKAWIKVFWGLRWRYLCLLPSSSVYQPLFTIW